MEVKITASRKKEKLHKEDSAVACAEIPKQKYYPLLELMLRELKEEQRSIKNEDC